MTHPYIVTYQDFTGHAVRKAWRGQGQSQVRNKAMERADCKSVTEVKEVTEAEFTALSEGQRRTKQLVVRNRKRYA